ncbi:MAG: hypothetical protein E6507_06895 [Prevotella bivia]|jgi:hypothetical protein|uniref:Uncharacterized protein n=2 Tax=Prevotella bivia TaxID=28125 RepID=I4Z7B8_9BACT|nr:hypothetical protein [Prevotella bivia]EFB92259.1 hypothetical protein HMPREF0648_1800 [Prevotella bivia JCVIHMP010]EIM32110.1 hypothetical protein PrebiDRAFT_0340 [Prevotella bivia DSM 20514]KXO17490.1 hypothetical protein HMPREF3202_01030 [Prevotella bivia]KXU59156.1 hypothetical protein HMPREF3218_0200656 [Prevotella bivia]MDU2329541.1 hypothetical protein [Prevotella bivia]
MNDINFIAIDFETATGKRASICEAGIYHTTRITVQAMMPKSAPNCS